MPPRRAKRGREEGGETERRRDRERPGIERGRWDAHWIIPRDP